MERYGRCIRILLLCVALTVLLCASARAEDTLYAANGGNLHFDQANGTIMDCDETVTKVVIPAEIKGVTVSAIGDEAFSDCKKLTSVKIPDGVTAIGNGAFRNCVSMTGAEIPDSLIRIGNEAFSGCRSLSAAKIPEGVTSIGERAFQGCRSVKSVTIPQSVRVIGNGAFLDCDRLNSIDVTSGNAFYSGTAGVLFSADRTRLIRYPQAKPDTSYTLPYGVSYIGERAFQGCNLTEVRIPSSVVTLEDGAFENCAALESVNLPENVTSVGVGAFFGNQSLKAVTIPEGVTVVRDGIFSGCIALREVSLPNSVLFIRSNAFENCRALEQVEIPNRVTSIGDSAFRNCASLTELELPNGVQLIGESAFENCADLTAVEFPASVRSIGWDAFKDCGSLRNVYYAGSEAQWEAIEELSHSGLISGAITIHYDSAGPEAPEVKLTSGPLAGKQILRAADLNGLKEVTVPLTTDAETPLEITVLTPFYSAEGRFVGMGAQTETIDKDTASVTVPLADNVSGASDMKILLCGGKRPLSASLRYHIPA